MSNPTKPLWKRALKGFAVLYAAAWVVTAVFGGRQLERQVSQALPAISETERRYAARQLKDYKDVVRKSPPGTYPSTWAKTTCIAPFVIYVDSGQLLAPLCGTGQSALYFWFFGSTRLVRTYGQWIA